MSNNAYGYKLFFEFSDNEPHDVEIIQIKQGIKIEPPAYFVKEGGFEYFIEHSSQNTKIIINLDFQKVYQMVIRGSDRYKRKETITQQTIPETITINEPNKEEIKENDDLFSEDDLLIIEETEIEEDIIDLDLQINCPELLEQAKQYI